MMQHKKAIVKQLSAGEASQWRLTLFGAIAAVVITLENKKTLDSPLPTSTLEEKSESRVRVIMPTLRLIR